MKIIRKNANRTFKNVVAEEVDECEEEEHEVGRNKKKKKEGKMGRRRCRK